MTCPLWWPLFTLIDDMINDLVNDLYVWRTAYGLGKP